MVIGTTYVADNSVREDVSELIYQITPTSKPLYNMMADGAAIAPLHEWQTRSLTTYTHNAAQEGFSYSFTDEIITTTRETNRTQIFNKFIRVSETTQATQHYAIGDYLSDQIQQRLAEIGTDFEHALINSTVEAGHTGSARQMAGILQATYSGSSTYTDDDGYSFTGANFEDRFNDYVQMLWDLGAEGRDCFVPGRVKRYISAFTSSNTMFQKADERTVIASIGLYETDFFPVEVHLSRAMPTSSANYSSSPTFDGSILFVDRTALKKAWLRSPEVETVAKTADARDAVIKGEFTLEFGNRNMHLFAGLTSFGT